MIGSFRQPWSRHDQYFKTGLEQCSSGKSSTRVPSILCLLCIYVCFKMKKILIVTVFDAIIRQDSEFVCKTFEIIRNYVFHAEFRMNDFQKQKNNKKNLSNARCRLCGLRYSKANVLRVSCETHRPMILQCIFLFYTKIWARSCLYYHREKKHFSENKRYVCANVFCISGEQNVLFSYCVFAKMIGFSIKMAFRFTTTRSTI